MNEYAIEQQNVVRSEVTEIVKGIYQQQNQLMAKGEDGDRDEGDPEEHLIDKLHQILRVRIPKFLPTVDSVIGIPLAVE